MLLTENTHSILSRFINIHRSCSRYGDMWHTLLLRAVLAAIGAVGILAHMRLKHWNNNKGHYDTVTQSLSIDSHADTSGQLPTRTRLQPPHRSILTTIGANRHALVTGGAVAFTMAMIRQARNVVRTRSLRLQRDLFKLDHVNPVPQTANTSAYASCLAKDAFFKTFFCPLPLSKYRAYLYALCPKHYATQASRSK
jgi:hypothetical protein